jgi:uncharacterized iron-regulated membrane protein
MNLRKLHRKTAPIIFLPLFIAALTGIAYRLGYSWFNIPNEVADFLMVLHEGRYLGAPLVPVYVLLVGSGLLGLIATGLTLIQRKRTTSASPPKRDWRWFHRGLAPIAFLPLIVSAFTGISYRIGKDWLGWSNDRAEIFLRIHQGSYLGPDLKPIYVLLVGIGLIGLLITGIQMSGIFRKLRSQT